MKFYTISTGTHALDNEFITICSLKRHSKTGFENLCRMIMNKNPRVETKEQLINILCSEYGFTKIKTFADFNMDTDRNDREPIMDKRDYYFKFNNSIIHIPVEFPFDKYKGLYDAPDNTGLFEANIIYETLKKHIGAEYFQFETFESEFKTEIIGYLNLSKVYLISYYKQSNAMDKEKEKNEILQTLRKIVLETIPEYLKGDETDEN